MDWEFDCALERQHRPDRRARPAPEARSSRWPWPSATACTSALVTLAQSWACPSPSIAQRFIEQWHGAAATSCRLARSAVTGDGGQSLSRSHSLILAHEDKNYRGRHDRLAQHSVGRGQGRRGPGRLPPGLDARHVQQRHRPARGRQHRRRRCGRSSTWPARSGDDGGFYQNFWIDGAALLARHPARRGRRSPSCWPGGCTRPARCETSTPIRWCMRAAGYLIRNGPATPQERWEENSGYSPSTLAANIAALICAACFARERGDEATAALPRRVRRLPRVATSSAGP